MKLHITAKQLNELSLKANAKLRKEWKPKKGDLFATPVVTYKGKAPIKIVYQDYEYLISLHTEIQAYECECDWCMTGGELVAPLLSIGQMIECIRENTEHSYEFKRSPFTELMVHAFDSYEHMPIYNLCDQLWAIVKAILNK